MRDITKSEFLREIKQLGEHTLVYRLRKRAEIRRSIPRGEPDRIAELLEEAADRLEHLEESRKLSI